LAAKASKKDWKIRVNFLKVLKFMPYFKDWKSFFVTLNGIKKNEEG
jgi:hypothetical protein